MCSEDHLACSVVEPSKYLPAQRYSNLVTDDEEIVGFEKDTGQIVQHLIEGRKELAVIPIVGMVGQGKTTIARKVYNIDRVVSHFNVRACCCISQAYNRIELLQEIFSQVTGSKDKVDYKVDELADMLRKRLMFKRYFIVLDDLWNVMAWDDLRFSFPDDKNGSRILVTTRLEEVGEQVKQCSDTYFLPFLSTRDSCKLLQKRVFQKEDCPPRLQDASLEVAQRCKGLPLVIILVAGIIKRKRMEESWWHEVKNSLISALGESEEDSLSTMQLSYDYLPNHLKPCLLYMGMFPEDARIPVSQLISLWIAEGFVQNIESGTLEEGAESYLMDLISSNVVMVSRRRYDGKVKYCQVHDIVLHFCLERSRGEKFMLEVKGDYRDFLHLDGTLNRLRLNVTADIDDFRYFALLHSKTRKPFHQLRSLITTNGSELLYWNAFRQDSKLGLLKVLDLSSCTVRGLSSAKFCPLIHLKYLAVCTDQFDFHPESHLHNLETLIVRSFYANVALPAIFWKMEKLRHVEVDQAFFDLEHNKEQNFEESSKLENLRILRDVEIPSDDADSMYVLLQRCPYLEELELTISSNEDSAEICTSGTELESLTHLKSLYLTFYDSVSELHLPSNLKKLALTGPHVVTAACLIVGLPCLEYLLLKDSDYESKEWCLGDITFHKLKFLKLVELGISSLDASEESFPELEILAITKCDKLEEIPDSFANIGTLKQIKLIRCKNKSLKDSAEQIKKEVEEIEGNDRVVLIFRDW